MTAVAVVGGGPARAAAAIGLARCGLRPVVLDCGRAGGEKVGECLPPLANPLLDVLGLTGRLEAAGHLRSHGIRAAWGLADLAERDFLFGRLGPGWHVDRTTFEAELAEVAREAGTEWRVSTRVTRVARDGDRWMVLTDSPGGNVATDFVIDATGRRAIVARRLGVRRVYFDRLVGAAAVLSGPAPTEAPGLVSLVEAVPDGWWYSAPLPGGRLTVLFMTDADLPAVEVARTPDGWRRLLAGTRHTARRVADGRYDGPPEVRVATAATGRLAACSGDGWAAVGDAAATFDPLSSHGIYSALAGGYDAGRAVAEAVGGQAAKLEAYSDALEKTFAEYLSLRGMHYWAERRWPGSTFWRRRQSDALRSGEPLLHRAHSSPNL